jgi:hypothetical protein
MTARRKRILLPIFIGVRMAEKIKEGGTRGGLKKNDILQKTPSK